MGSIAQAATMQQQVLEARRRMPGAEHPDIISSVNSLANCIDSQGKHAEAEPMYQNALDLHTRVLGAEHPDTISSIDNLDTLLHEQGRHQEAEPLLRKALRWSCQSVCWGQSIQRLRCAEDGWSGTWNKGMVCYVCPCRRWALPCCSDKDLPYRLITECIPLSNRL